MIKTIITTILISITATLAIPGTQVFAIDLPDNIQIISADVYRNIVEDGDVLVIFHGKVNYDSYNGTYPTTPASSTIMLRLIADNVTQLAAASPYVYSPFDTNGYGDFVSGFYFGADSAPEWGVGHKINIVGLSWVYDPVPKKNYTLKDEDYNSSTEQDDNRSDLYIEIIRLADKLKVIYPDVSLKSITDVGTVLSAYGEAYFKSAIPGLDDMCPALFYVQVYTPEIMDTVPYTTDLADDMAEHTRGGDLMRGMTRLGVHIGVSGEFMVGILTFVLVLGICIFSFRKGWGIEPGLLLSLLLVILMAVLIGDFMFNLMMIIALIAAIGIMYMFTIKRS